MYVGILRMEFAEALDGRELSSLIQKIRKKYSVAIHGDRHGVVAVTALMNTEDNLKQLFENILDACELHAGRVETDWMLFEDLELLHSMEDDEEEEEGAADGLRRASSINFR